METDTIKTCQNCAVAKIRCHRSQSQGPCDRCRRLHKDCVFRPARRRFNPAPRDSRTDTLTSIEAKIDQLLSFHEADRSESAASRATTPDSRDVLDAGIITLKTADYYVALYKSDLTPHFPFVVLHPDVSAQQLRQERPMLFLAVLTAAAYGDVSVQRELADRMRIAIGECISGRICLSFELLQALLVHLAWSQYHPRPKRYSQYLQLAISIIIDQRLDRPPRIVPWKTHVGSNVDEQAEPAQPPPTQPNDIQRAISGCYYLSSSVSVLLQKLNTFQCTAYIEDCCKSLSANPEFPTDKYLHSIIYIQRCMESIDPCGPLPADYSAVANFSRIQMELGDWKNTIAFPVDESHLVFMLYHTAQLHTIQMRLFASGERPGNSWDICDVEEGFRTASSLFGFQLSLPLRKEVAFNNSEWLQLSFALTAAAKMVLAASDPAIADRTKELRDSLDVLSLLSQIGLRLGAMESSAVDNSGEPDVFHQYGQRVKRMQARFEERCARAQKGEQAAGLPIANEQIENGLPQLSGEDLLLPDPHTLDGLAAYDVQLASFFPDDLQMEDGWGNWAMYPNVFRY